MATRTNKNYNSGDKDITPESIKDNTEAIRMLMRDLEQSEKEVKNLKNQISKMISMNSAVNTSKDYNTYAIILNVLGTAAIAFGVNLITNSNPARWQSFFILGLGIVSYLLSAFMVARYNWVVACWDKLTRFIMK